MDQMVLETQKWLNKTYSFETGMVPQDGKTGWRTIYALRRALQQEMGITATSDNFGPTTGGGFVVATGVGFGTAVTTTGTAIIQSVASFFATLKVTV